MPNNIQPYDQIWYAQKMLAQLARRLNFVAGISRDVDKEPQRQGSTIKAKRPGTFVVQQMPSATKQSIRPSEDQMTLNQWWGTQFVVRDDELAFTGDEIIRQHIDPAINPLAEKIEQTAIDLYKDVPHVIDAAGTVDDFVDMRTKFNGLNVDFQPSSRQLALGGMLEATYLKADLFKNANTDADGGQVQRTGKLGVKMGISSYSVPMLGSTAPGVLNVTSGTLLLNGAVTGDHSNPKTSLVLDATAMNGTVKKGDTFTVAGCAQPFAVTADATAAGNVITVSIFPQVPDGVALADNAAVTLRQGAAKGVSIAHTPGAFGLVMAPLSASGDGKGAEIAYAYNAATGLAIRSMRWYDPLAKEHLQGFDALWGVKCWEPNQAFRVER